MKNVIAALGAGLCVLSFAAAAEPGLSYNYVQGAYISLNPDNSPVDASGFSVGASGLIGQGVFLFGNYADAKTDDFSVGPFSGNLESKQYTAGLGLRGPLAYSQGTDLNLSAAYVRLEGETNGNFPQADSSDNGYQVGAGIRHLFAPQFEIGLGAVYENIGDTGIHHTTGQANALFHVTPIFSILGGYSYNSYQDGWAVGGRVNF